ncbi:hypothetical protein Ddc_07650 [Ditylenchus destructor]|nr:hypothetical protein Ddc_07650 [Ditylenchus destructor]
MKWAARHCTNPLFARWRFLLQEPTREWERFRCLSPELLLEPLSKHDFGGSSSFNVLWAKFPLPNVTDLLFELPSSEKCLGKSICNSTSGSPSRRTKTVKASTIAATVWKPTLIVAPSPVKIRSTLLGVASHSYEEDEAPPTSRLPTNSQ